MFYEVYKKKGNYYNCLFNSFLFFYIYFFRGAGLWLVKKDIPKHSDAIIMLMGSIPDRVLETFDNYNAKYASEIILVEESMGAVNELEKRGIKIISNTAQCKNALIQLGVKPENIISLKGSALSTQQEALIIRNYFSDKSEIDTVLLVTSSEHTRRASIIFKYAFEKIDKTVKIYSIPSKYSRFDGKKWWKDKENIQAVVSEYVKLINFWFFDKRKL